LVHDWIAALQHNPWEFAHRGSAKRTLQAVESSLKSNEDNWRSHQSRARSVLNEAIASLDHHIDRVEKKGDVEASMIKLARLEIDLAQQALAEDNTPAVERALSRGEAALLLPIQEDEDEADGSILIIEEDIPFVDLSDDASE
jgi:seryl-tRNA(Sec) selenium transferase